MKVASGLFLALLVAVAAWFWHFAGGTVYPGSVDENYRKVAALPTRPGGMAEGFAKIPSGLDMASEKDPGKSVVWKFRIKGRTFARYSVQFTPVDATKSRVLLTYEVTRPEVLDEARLGKSLQGMIQYVGANVLDDYVRSALEGRPFDAKNAEKALLAYVAMHPQDYAEAVRDFQKTVAGLAFAAQRAEFDGWRERKYGSTASKESGSTEPMTDLGRFNRGY